MMDDYDILDAELSSVKGGMTEHEAFYGILYAAVKADGETDPREKEELEALSHRSNALHELYENKRKEFDAIKSSVEGRFADLKGRDVAKRALDVIAEAAVPIRQNQEMAISAYAHAVDIVFADSKVVDLEKVFLKTLAKALDIPATEAKAVIKYLALKNKF